VRRELAVVAPDLASKQAELRHAQETLGALTLELVDKQRRAAAATVELSNVQVRVWVNEGTEPVLRGVNAQAALGSA
jgi:hypothetical protein